MSTRPGLSVELDGVQYVIEPGDFTGLDDLAVVQATGYTLLQLFRRLRDEPALFALAALIWRYRVGDGETDLTFEQVASQVNFETLTTIDLEADEADVPKASGGD